MSENTYKAIIENISIDLLNLKDDIESGGMYKYETEKRLGDIVDQIFKSVFSDDEVGEILDKVDFKETMLKLNNRT